MKYLLLVCWGTDSMEAEPEPAPGERDEESFPWLDDLQARGAWVTGDRLGAPSRARTVRVRDGKTLVTDGPFTETKESLGGFYLLDCNDLDEAAKLAAQIPGATTGAIELRAAAE